MNNTYFPAATHQLSQSPMVEFSISTDSLSDVLDFLVTQKISFGMTYTSQNIPKIVSETILDEAQTMSERNNVSYPNLPKSPVQRIVESIYKKYIEENIEQIPPKEIDIAKEYNLKAATFKTTFKALYGKPFYQLYMEKKMKYAAILLRKGYRANAVSKRIGYSQPIKFNMVFQKYMGMTPKKYQTLHLK